jgi:predicted trehalose synthase
MKLTTKTYIAIGAAVLLIAGILGSWLLSNHKISRLERAVATAKALANEKESHAIAKEIEAAEYKQKIEYLETQLAEIGGLARKQDEELEKLNVISHGARGDVERARRTRSVAATAEQLCQKLAEVGHPCD